MNDVATNEILKISNEAFRQQTNDLINDIFNNLKISVSHNDPIIIQYYINQLTTREFIANQQYFLQELTDVIQKSKQHINLDELEDFKNHLANILNSNKNHEYNQKIINELEKCFSTLNALIDKYSVVTIENRNSMLDIKQSLIKVNNLNNINETPSITKLQRLTNILNKVSWLIVGTTSINIMAMISFWYLIFFK